MLIKKQFTTFDFDKTVRVTVATNKPLELLLLELEVNNIQTDIGSYRNKFGYGNFDVSVV